MKALEREGKVIRKVLFLIGNRHFLIRKRHFGERRRTYVDLLRPAVPPFFYLGALP